MRAVAQRVHSARVTVDGEVVGQIARGLLVYLGAADGDTERDLDYVAGKLVGLRVFPDGAGKMSLALPDLSAGPAASGTTGSSAAEGAMLVISQFTLFGDVRRGRRPSFDGAAPPEDANRMYEDLCGRVRGAGIHVETGRFRAMMEVHSVVDGPVTILIDSRKSF